MQLEIPAVEEDSFPQWWQLTFLGPGRVAFSWPLHTKGCCIPEFAGVVQLRTQNNTILVRGLFWVRAPRLRCGEIRTLEWKNRLQ
jgi:hypothetical protein